jgi:hypothetical protein
VFRRGLQNNYIALLGRKINPPAPATGAAAGPFAGAAAVPPLSEDARSHLRGELATLRDELRRAIPRAGPGHAAAPAGGAHGELQACPAAGISNAVIVGAFFVGAAAVGAAIGDPPILDDTPRRKRCSSRCMGDAYGLQLSQASALRQRGIAGRLRRSFERVLELDSANEAAHVRLVQFHLTAPGVAGGDRAAARRHAEALVRYNGYVGALMLQSVHAAAHDTVAVEATLRGMLTSYPDSVVPRIGLATLYQDRNRPREAWTLLQPLVETERPHSGALYLVGRLSAVTGTELDRGERALREYLRSTPAPDEPPHAAARTRLGDILRHRGDVAGARREYEAALRLDPDFQQAKDALRRLR